MAQVPTFTTCIYLEGLTGTFPDPYYPWLSYEYALDACEGTPIAGQLYAFKVSLRNPRGGGNSISGLIEVSVGVNSETPVPRSVKFELGDGDTAELARKLAQFRADNIFITVKHHMVPVFLIHGANVIHRNAAAVETAAKTTAEPTADSWSAYPWCLFSV